MGELELGSGLVRARVCVCGGSKLGTFSWLSLTPHKPDCSSVIVHVSAGWRKRGKKSELLDVGALEREGA
jgi:hypothetical protein